jgi:KDO2-lipid IV(A) lauroyltransferase
MYLLYLIAWKFIGILPEKAAYQLANLVADYINKRNGKGVKRLRSNYRRVLPKISESELATLTKSGMRSYLRYWFDTFRLNKWSKSRIIETTYVIRENLLRDPIASKQGCIVALPHAGNWDHAAAYFCSTGITLTAVVEKLKPEAIFKKFLAYRSSIGIEPISPATLAIKSGSPLITAYIRYLKDGIEITFDETIKLPTSGSEAEKIQLVTQSMADNFAKRIKDSPVDWHMLQRIWVDEEN